MALHGGAGAGGGVAAPMPPEAPRAPSGGASDTAIAKTVEQHLIEAVQAIRDPALKATFSTAINALHKYLAQDQKEHEQALGGKLSPKLMARAHGA